MALSSSFKTKVVGVTYVPGYPGNLFTLNDIAASRYLGEFSDSTHEPEPIPALLIRNPANEFDANAIEVHVPSMGDQAMIGHVPAALAARLAPLLDDGEKWGAFIYNVDIDPNHPRNPGLSLSVERYDDGEPF